MDRSDLLVAGQAAALIGVVWPGRPRWDLPRPGTAAAVGLVLAGGALALEAVRPHGRHLTPRVRPPRGAGLLTDGAYAHVRNPIYAGLGMATTGVALLRRRPGPLLATALLAVDLSVKARAEETALVERFGDAYRAYAARTPRLIPSPLPLPLVRTRRPSR